MLSISFEAPDYEMARRPYQSWNYHGVEVDTDRALQPDTITIGMSHIARKMSSVRDFDAPIKVAEIGAGATPFLSTFATRAHKEPLHLLAIDNDSDTISHARYNTLIALKQRKNAQDKLAIVEGSWEDLKEAGQCFDISYFNPPFLAHGEAVRSSFSRSPKPSMFVPDSKDGLDNFRNFAVIAPDLISLGGLMFVRTPNDPTKRDHVIELFNENLDEECYTIHEINIDTAWHKRKGGGFVVEKAKTLPQIFEYGDVRIWGDEWTDLKSGSVEPVYI